MDAQPTLGDAAAKAAKRYAQLPPAVRALLAEMRDDDVDALKWMIGLHKSVNGWCRINRWIFRGAFVGTVTFLILLTDALDTLKGIPAALARVFGKQ